MINFDHVLINKNRGWRGLTKAIVYNDKKEIQLQMIFSFSQPMWKDLIKYNTMILQDDKYYYVVKFTEDCHKQLPRPEQQRSVLIKNAMLAVSAVNRIKKENWRASTGFDWECITHFIKNKNNHTTSDWNCIGVRVIPEI